MKHNKVTIAFAMVLLLSSCNLASISQTNEAERADKSIAIEDTSADMCTVSIDGISSNRNRDRN